VAPEHPDLKRSLRTSSGLYDSQATGHRARSRGVKGGSQSELQRRGLSGV
jgi:hypothetical protein